MSEPLELLAGSEVRCTDGRVGRVGGLIVDPRAGTVTHVSVSTRSGRHNGRLVPVDQVQSAGPVIQLACAKDVYYGFLENEEFVTPVVASPQASVLHVRLVPHGETAFDDNEAVHAADGRAGSLVGLAVDPDGHAVQALLVQVGHLLSHRRVSIPYDTVTEVDKHGIHLRLSKDELSALPG